MKKINVLWYSQNMMPEKLKDTLEPCKIVWLKHVVNHASDLKGYIDFADVVCLDAPIQFKYEALNICGNKPILVAHQDEMDPDKSLKWDRLLTVRLEYEEWNPYDITLRGEIDIDKLSEDISSKIEEELDIFPRNHRHLKTIVLDILDKLEY